MSVTGRRHANDSKTTTGHVPILRSHSSYTLVSQPGLMTWLSSSKTFPMIIPSSVLTGSCLCVQTPLFCPVFVIVKVMSMLALVCILAVKYSSSMWVHAKDTLADKANNKQKIVPWAATKILLLVWSSSMKSQDIKWLLVDLSYYLRPA